MSHTATLLALAAGLSVAVANLAAPAVSQGKAGEEEAAFATPTFADVAALTEKASLVVLVEVRDQAVVKPERAPGLAPGYARLYIEGRTQALLGGRAALGESLVYLVDAPLDEDGDPPKLKKQRFIVFANPVRRDRRARRDVGRRQPGRRIGNAAVSRHRDRRAGFAQRDSPSGDGTDLGRVVDRDRRSIGARAGPADGRMVPARLLAAAGTARRFVSAAGSCPPSPGARRLPLHSRSTGRMRTHAGPLAKVRTAN